MTSSQLPSRFHARTPPPSWLPRPVLVIGFAVLYIACLNPIGGLTSHTNALVTSNAKSMLCFPRIDSRRGVAASHRKLVHVKWKPCASDTTKRIARAQLKPLFCQGIRQVETHPSISLLIDGERMGEKEFGSVIEAVAQQGVIVTRRVYGHTADLDRWSRTLDLLQIVPVPEAMEKDTYAWPVSTIAVASRHRNKDFDELLSRLQKRGWRTYMVVASFPGADNPGNMDALAKGLAIAA